MARWPLPGGVRPPLIPCAALTCVAAAFFGLNAVGCSASHPHPTPSPNCVLPTGRPAAQSLTVSYQEPWPSLCVSAGTAVTVIVPEYQHQTMALPSSGDLRVACLAATWRRGDGLVQAIFVALRPGTSVSAGGLAQATRAMMPAYGGTLIVVRRP
jgi:hypothetical protein